MTCKNCNTRMYIVDKREDNGRQRRRYVCKKCGSKVTGYELMESEYRSYQDMQKALANTIPELECLLYALKRQRRDNS